MTKLTGIELSKFLSLILRHKPEEIDIKIDAFGYAIIDELISKSASVGYIFSKQDLLHIVENNDKQRFEINEESNKIKARQGHSIKVKLNLKPITPPNYLFHGTRLGYRDKILNEGIKSMERKHVHMNEDFVKSYISGGRSSKTALVFKVKASQMFKEGYDFYRTENDVWLSDYIPAKYIQPINLKDHFKDAIKVKIVKRTVYTKLYNSKINVSIRSNVLHLNKLYCPICGHDKCSLSFERNNIVCRRYIEKWSSKQVGHTIEGGYLKSSISQDAKTVITEQYGELIISGSQLNLFNSGTTLENPETVHHSTGLWYTCPSCSIEGRVFPSVIANELIKCDECQTKMFEAKTEVEIKTANNGYS